MCLIYLSMNVFYFYKYKMFKRTIADKSNINLSQMFQYGNKISQNAWMMNYRNIIKIFFLNIVSVIALIDLAFDLVFVALCYGSGVVWLAILVGLSYIYTFFDKIHSLRKLFGLVRDQYHSKKESNILLDH